jgi:hypothetical protein
LPGPIGVGAVKKNNHKNFKKIKAKIKIDSEILNTSIQ